MAYNNLYSVCPILPARAIITTVLLYPVCQRVFMLASIKLSGVIGYQWHHFRFKYCQGCQMFRLTILSSGYSDFTWGTKQISKSCQAGGGWLKCPRLAKDVTF